MMDEQHIKRLAEAARRAHDLLSDFLNGSTPEDEKWEDVWPELNEARTILGEVLYERVFS